MRLIGVRIYETGTVTEVRKNLTKEWYPFFDTYHFDDLKGMSDQELLAKIKGKHEEVDGLEKSLYQQGDESPDISVHAIVGKNGCGKSTLLEIVFRIINNLAWKTIGDEKRKAAERLFWAPDLTATLFYTVGSDKMDVCCYLACEAGGRIELVTGKKKVTNEELIYHYKELKDFFFSIIVNYSHYSLNTKEIWKREEVGYEEPLDSDDGRALYFANNVRATTEHPAHWLKGLFHKNDGYLTPITIHPMRTEGNFDVNRETKLSRSRLMGILTLYPDFLENYTATHFELTFSLENFMQKLRDQEAEFINKHLTEKDSNLAIYSMSYIEVLLDIYNFWYEKIGYKKTKLGRDTKITNLATIEFYLKYLVSETERQIQVGLLYMTIKSISISTKYDDFKLEKPEDIPELVKKIFDTTTHITAKVHQTLTHIQKRLLGDNPDESFKSVVDKSLFRIPISELKKESGDGIDQVLANLYPPIYQTEIILERRSVTEGQDREVTLQRMSSGERQMLYSMSAILYHLLNLKSVEEDTYRVKYADVNVILDEVEMYYHPEYQRRYLHTLLSSIKGLKLGKEEIRSINICIVTHSPFLLSDILKRNILFLKEGKVANQEVGGETFGANVYDILKNGFFFDESALGCFVSGKIQEALDYINGEKESLTKEQAREIAELIGDPLIKGYLLLNI